jgi:hypothetical protein
LTRALFRADIERHWASFRAYDVPQTVIARPPPLTGNKESGKRHDRHALEGDGTCVD